MLKLYNICLARGGGGLERMFLNYDEILENHINILSSNSWVLKNIKSNNHIIVNKCNVLYKLFKLINNSVKSFFICHCKRSLYYLNILKWYFGSQIITILVNHNHTKIKKTLSADYSIIISSKMNKIFIENKYNEKKILTLNNFSIRGKRKIFLKKSIKNIAFIGRLITRKGCFKMITQLKNILINKNLKLNIYGDGKEFNKILSYIKQHNLSKYIELHGWIDDISKCYENNDIIIVPSIYDVFPVIIIDAFYYNCPCIISDNVLINNEIIFNEDNCLTYDINNNNELEEKIIKLINNNDLFNKIQINGFDTYNKKLSHHIAKNKLNDIINNILKKEVLSNENLTFKNEFTKFKDKLLNNEYFSLVRFGDGEINYINRKKVNASDHQCNSNEIPIKFCNMLKESLCYNDNNYYIGIPCSCCEYRDKFRMNIENNFKVNNNNLTFANIFTNSNYFHFKKNIIPILKKYPIILISNKNTKLHQFINLGYNVKKWFSVDYNAWKNYQEIIDQVLNYSKSNNIVNHLYIVCAGPVSNVLIYNLQKQENRNIYLDLGSVIDNELGLGTGTRNYNKIFGWKSLSTCYWDKPSYWYQISCDSQSKSKIMRFFLRIISLIFSLYNFIRFYFI